MRTKRPSNSLRPRKKVATNPRVRRKTIADGEDADAGESQKKMLAKMLVSKRTTPTTPPKPRSLRTKTNNKNRTNHRASVDRDVVEDNQENLGNPENPGNLERTTTRIKAKREVKATEAIVVAVEVAEVDSEAIARVDVETIKRAAASPNVRADREVVAMAPVAARKAETITESSDTLLPSIISC